MKLRRKVLTVAASLVSTLGLIGFTQPAQAAIPGGYHTSYDVINKTTSSSYYTNYSNQLASCTALSSGITCTISKSTSATRTISLDLGVSRDLVAAKLAISSAYTQSITVSCTSPKMYAGQTFRAYPVGTRYQYRVQKKTVSGPSTTTQTSGYLYAFNPRANSFACQVR